MQGSTKGRSLDDHGYRRAIDIPLSWRDLQRLVHSKQLVSCRVAIVPSPSAVHSAMKTPALAIGLLASVALARPGSTASPAPRPTPSSATSAATSSTPPAAKSQPEPLNDRGYALFAMRPGSPIHKQAISATSLGFWIGAETSTYCPTDEVPDCATYTANVTAISGSDGCSMVVDVPGGQNCFIDGTTGALGFTSPHSEEMPPGAINYGFEFQNGTSGNAQYGTLGYDVDGATGFVACPSAQLCAQQAGANCTIWNVRANIKGANTTNCLDMTVVTQRTPAVAWEYA